MVIAKVDFCSFIFWTRRKILQLLIPNSSEHSKIDPSNGEEKRESAWRKEQRMKRGKGSGSRTRSITRNEWAFLESMHDPSVAEDASAFSISFFFWGRPSPWAKRENFSFHASEQRNFSALVTEESKFRQDNVVWTITKKFGQLEIFFLFPFVSLFFAPSCIPFSFSSYFSLFYDISLSDRLKWRNIQFCSFSSFFFWSEVTERNE